MALRECGMNLNRNLKELQPHGSIAFPCAAYASHRTEKMEDIISWHWHEEMELICIEQGQMTVKTPAASLLLGEGDLAAINSNILHYAAAAPECTFHSLVFSPMLITGNSNSAFAQKYIQPLLACSSFSCYLAAGNERVSHWFRCAFEAAAEDRYGFEFTVRENLSRICLFLCGEYEPHLAREAAPLNQDHLRIRKMLDCIHQNFAADITLQEISRAAGISERECLRCFNRTIQMSPIQYLLKYRVMQGAERLRGSPASSISENATSCGFDSPSNFAKNFKRYYGKTPREYRRLADPG